MRAIRFELHLSNGRPPVGDEISRMIHHARRHVRGEGEGGLA
jgi:hypothetical protein